MRHRYTDAEDRTIAIYLILYNFDRTDAFKVFAKHFGVTEKSVASRYYRRKETIEEYIDTLYMKYTLDNIACRPQEKWYKRLWNAVKSMLNISKYL